MSSKHAKAKVSKLWPPKHWFGVALSQIDNISEQTCMFTVEERPSKGDVVTVILRLPPKFMRIKQKAEVLTASRDTNVNRSETLRKRYLIKCKFINPSKYLLERINEMKNY